MAEIRLSSHARKSYLRLARSDRRLVARVDRALERLAEEPGCGKPLAGPLVGHRSLRVGSLRIVYRVEEDRGAVLVLDITRRGGAYR
ncbi:MAG: type II toxin-antitoxin system RelE/ParE family toxin [Thermoanaerobaculia bacterium]